MATNLIQKETMTINIPKVSGGLKAIESGSYGEIYLLKSSDGREIIAKKYLRSDARDRMAECIIMKDLSNYLPVATSYELVYSQSKFNMLMPYYKYQLLSIHPREDQVKYCLYQLLVFAHILSLHGVVHRDIKPQNIVIDDQGYIRVLDFGMAGYQQFIMNTEVVTVWYRAPEICGGKYYNNKADLWSIGCVIAQIILEKPLFCEQNNGQMLAVIKGFDEKFKKRFTEELSELKKHGKKISDYNPMWPMLKDLKKIYCFSPEIYEILMLLLTVNPKKRPSAMFLLKKYYSETFTKEGILYVPGSDRRLIDPRLQDIKRYHIMAGDLEMDQIKYKPKYRCWHDNNINAQGISIHKLYNSSTIDNKEATVTYFRDISTMSVHEITNKYLYTLVEKTLNAPDIQFDILVQSMYLFERVLVHLSEQQNWTMAKKIQLLFECYKEGTTDLKTIDNIVEKKLFSCSKNETVCFQKEDYAEILRICYTLIHELLSETYKTDPKLTWDECDNYVRQIILDMMNYRIKQDRQISHSAHNFVNYNTYTVMYNLLYLCNSDIRDYQYNYVICHLQIIKHGKNKTLLNKFLRDDTLCQHIIKFIEAGWEEIATKLDNLELNLTSMSNCRRYYKLYNHKYRKNKKCGNK